MILSAPQEGTNLPENPGLIMEYQVESERGFHFLGSVVFTSNTLLPLDPAHFTSVSGEPLGKNLTDFEVPDESWVWAWSQWYVDMAADVDDQGWCYSWRFGSKHWSGRHRFMRSFVRQRVWKRPRVNTRLLTNGSLESLTLHNKWRDKKLVSKEAPHEDYSASAATETGKTGTAEKEERNKEDVAAKTRQIVDKIATSRNDRERVNGIIDLVENSTEDIGLLVEIRDQLVGTLQYPVSRRSLISKLSESSNENCKVFVLAPSDAWRDQTLRRGEPKWEMESENRSIAENELVGSTNRHYNK